MAELDQALGTNLPAIPGGIAGDVQRKVRAGAEAEAGMASAVAQKTKELTAPIQAAKEQEVGTQQAKITSAGEQLAKPLEVPKETVQDMAALGGLAAVVGVMLGSSGKMSAQNTLGSMTGILDGYKKGNNDLIAKYQKEFEMNQKRLQSQIQQAQTELSVILEKYKVKDQTVAQDIAAFSAKYAGGIAATVADAKSAGDVARLNVQLAQMGQSAKQHDESMKRQDLQRQQQMEFQREEKEKDRRARRENIVLQTEGRAQTSGGAANARYAYNIAESFGQSAVDLLNVTRMPAGTVLGTFAGMTGQSGEGLVSSLTNTFARKITKDDARMMQQVVSGLEMNMARALGGGYASSSAKHMVDAYKQQVPKEGDSAVNTALFLSRVKQELDVLAKTFYKHPGANEGYVNQMNDYMKELNAAIPFDVPTVLEAARRGRQTISERFGGPATEPVRVPSLPATSATGTPAPVTSGTGTSNSPVSITSEAEFDALPSGTIYVGPDNVRRRKP
jgi:hypothetical protein